MNDRVPLRPGYRLWLPVLAVALVLTGLSAVIAPPATVQAAPVVTVRVIVERLKDIGNDADTLDAADFYGRVTIDGTVTDFGEITDKEEPSPNWTTPGKSIDVAVNPSIAVNIRVFDNDGFLNFIDNEFDISPEGGTRGLNLTVALNPCGVTIASIAPPNLCGASITTSGSAQIDAEIQFRVEINYPVVTGLRLRCTHGPVWPQPGQSVLITAEALDGALAARFADKIELFINNQGSPNQTATNATQLVTNLNLTPGATSFFYGCRIVMNNGDTVWTGWRRVQIGTPPASQGRAVPISVTGSSDGRVDFVFIRDSNSPTYVDGGATDATFLNDVATVIRSGLYIHDVYLSNQDAINFWIAQDAGTTALTPVAGSPLPRCTNTAPANWSTAYPSVDAGVLLHVPDCRDSANPNTRIFSVEPTSLPVVAHESGHRPFGLADEYCTAPTGTPGNCDGGYFQNAPNPNLFTTQAACQADPLAATIPGSCASFVSAAPTTTGMTFWRLDAGNNDLMQANGAFQPADTRRHDWLFTQCRTQRC